MNDEMSELCYLCQIKMKQIILNLKCPIIFIGTTSDILKVNSNIYQNGLFEMEYEISIPTSEQRFQMINNILSKVNHNINDDQLKYLVKNSNGYLPKDLTLLTQLAGVQSIKRYHKNEIDNIDKNEIKLIFEDFKDCMNEINPSIIKAYTTDIPKIKWNDIGGMEDVKNHLIECILWPIKYPNKLARMGIELSGGVLLYGPPGCSKTMMARALAGESNMNFISIKGPELLNKYVGETEKTIRDLFKKARLASPCILFFDEMDAIASQRNNTSSGHSDFNDRILAQFLTEIDGISGINMNLFIVAATNRPFSIDSALMRPGRFDRLVYVPLPDNLSRFSIFNLQLQKIPTNGNIDINKLVNATEGYSGAEIVALCKEAAYFALRCDINTEFIMMEHFNKALNYVKPRTTSNLIQMYMDFKNQHLKF